MDDADGLDPVAGVAGEPFFDGVRIGAPAPIARQEIHLETQPLGEPAPEDGELPGLVHQDPVAGGQRVDQGGFPGAGPGRRINDDGPRGLENGLQTVEDFPRHAGEVRPPVVDGGRVDGFENPVRHVGRPRNLQEMTAAPMGHGGLP